MNMLLNILLVAAFLVDRVFRLRSIKEFKEAKQAEIDTLKQQLEMERGNNDVQITNMHKQRYENLKMLLDEKELEMDNAAAGLLELQIALQKHNDTEKVLNLLVTELNRVERTKLSDGVKRALLLQQVKL